MLGVHPASTLDEVQLFNPKTNRMANNESEAQAEKPVTRRDFGALGSKQIEEWFTYHSPVADQPERYKAIRHKAKELAFVILDCTPPGADQTAAMRKLRECVMTANASIALEHPAT